LFAVATTTAQNQPTEYGDVVVEGYRFFAVRTGRARPHHRQTTRQAVDAHVQEAAEEQPEQEESCCDERIQSVSFTSVG